MTSNQTKAIIVALRAGNIFFSIHFNKQCMSKSNITQTIEHTGHCLLCFQKRNGVVMKLG